MLIHYYDAAVRTGVRSTAVRSPRESGTAVRSTAVCSTRNRLTLDDLHKHAWALFCRGRARTDAPDERPFIFRFEPLDAQSGLLTIRSAEPFAIATRRQLHIERGAVLPVRYLFVPAMRSGRRAWTPRSTEWAGIGARALHRAGLDLEGEPRAQLRGYWRKYHNTAPLPIAEIRTWATLTDPGLFAPAFLVGIGRQRGYGLGMIHVPPEHCIPVREAA